MNNPAGTAVIGVPGSGKTFFLLNQIANSLIMEIPIYALDFKNDLEIITNVFPEVEMIDINKISKGALNPFAVLNKVDTNTICSLISIICGNIDDNQMTSITPIVRDFVNRQKFKNMNSGSEYVSSFTELTDYLYANDNRDCQIIGNKLQTHKDSKYGHLIFDDPTEVSTKRNSLRLSSKSKIISFFGMDLPMPTTSGEVAKLTEEQKFNSGIIYIVTTMLKELLTGFNYPTLFVMDEAHIALKNQSFSNLLDEFLVLGRSLNIATVLATQNASHFPSGISQLIANKFCFKSSTEEALKFMDLFLNKTPENAADISSIVTQIGNFNSGDCFFIDDKGRSGIFKVTSLLGDISSNPLARKSREENND